MGIKSLREVKKTHSVMWALRYRKLTYLYILLLLTHTIVDSISKASVDGQYLKTCVDTQYQR